MLQDKSSGSIFFFGGKDLIMLWSNSILILSSSNCIDLPTPEHFNSARVFWNTPKTSKIGETAKIYPAAQSIFVAKSPGFGLLQIQTFYLEIICQADNDLRYTYIYD